MSAKKVLFKFKKRIDTEIEKFFIDEIKATSKISLYAKKLTESIRDFTLRGGKRVRGALLYHTYLIFDKREHPDLIKAAVFMELIQTYLLIHDDIIDEDNIRRGGKALHREYEIFYKANFQKRNSEHFGKSMGIIAGDLTAHMALRLLSSLDFPGERKVKAFAKIHEQILDVGFGEMLDVILENEVNVSEEDILLVHKMKTAKYTFETPVHVGGILAGANDDNLKVLSDYALPAGIAFQIQDDILGMFGDEKKMGKPAYSDLREGKQTLLILRALENATEKERNVAKKALGNRNLTKTQHEAVKKIITNTGSLEYSRKLAKKYALKAKDALKRLNKDNVGKDFVESIVEYMIKREF